MGELRPLCVMLGNGSAIGLLLLCAAQGCRRKPGAAPSDAPPVAVAVPARVQRPWHERTPVTDRNRKAGKLLTESNDEHGDFLKECRARLTRAETAQDRVRVLRDVAGEDVRGGQLLDLAALALRDPDEDVRLEALRLVADFNSPRILEVIRGAAGDPSESVRQAAVECLRFVSDPGVADVLCRAVTDPDEGVRYAVLDNLEAQADEVKLAVAKAAIRSGREDVAVPGITLAAHLASKPSFAVLLEGLAQDNSAVRMAASQSIEFLVGEVFEDAASARRWWTMNREKLDAQLMPKEADAADEAPER